MTDLISRQAAIQEIREWQWRMPPEGMVDRINALPSEGPDIIRCKDCKHGSPNGKYGCRVYHYKRYETHDMEPDDFCSRAERRQDG